MPFYEYRAVDGEGNPVRGARRGETPDDVRKELAAEGLRASVIRRKDDPGAGGLLRRGVTGEDLALLHRQTANLLATGLPLPRALRAVARESGKRALELLADAVASDVEKGRTLSDALRDHARVVPSFMADLVKAGEAAGNLQAVLLDVAAGAEAEARVRRSVRTALAYPMTVAALALAVVILNGTGILGAYFFPKREDVSLDRLYGDMNTVLPAIYAPARSLAILLDIVCSPWVWGFLIAAFLFAGGYLAPALSLRGSRAWVPVFGKLVRQVLVSRFCRVLGLLAGRGVPIPMALRLAGAASDSADLAAQSAAAAEDVEAGRSLADAVDALRVLPPTTRWGIAAAAARGGLPDELAALARAADEDGADVARRFSVVLETSLIVLIGVFVFFGGGGSIVRGLLNSFQVLPMLTWFCY